MSSMLEERGDTLSNFVMFCMKYVVLSQGSEIFTDFQKHYQKLIETRLGDTVVKYKGQVLKLDDLLESELLAETGFIKI